MNLSGQVRSRDDASSKRNTIRLCLCHRFHRRHDGTSRFSPALKMKMQCPSGSSRIASRHRYGLIDWIANKLEPSLLKLLDVFDLEADTRPGLDRADLVQRECRITDGC